MEAEAMMSALGAILDEKSDEYFQIHRIRYFETLRLISAFLPGIGDILELGGESPILECLALEGYNTANCTSDLRYPLDLPANRFDCLLLLEVFEHLKDASYPGEDINSICCFNSSGINCLAAEMYRILRPGGLAYLTTPNACSVDALIRVVKMMPPMGYPLHVREYAPSEVRDVFRKHGFCETAFETFYAWNPPTGSDRKHYIDFLERDGSEVAHRGDDMFFCFQKPHAAKV